MKVIEHIIEGFFGLLLGICSFIVMTLLGVAMLIPNLRRYEHMRHM